MGFRLFRRIRIAPGLSLNLSKGGLSLSAGVRGARVTLGRRGVRRTVGIPGTGISYSETSGGGTPDNDERSGQGVGCGTILLALIVLGLVVNQCSPSTGSSPGSDDPSAEATPQVSLEPSGRPTPDITAPIALSVDALPVVKPGSEVSLQVRAAYGSSCEIGVPLAARTGDGPTTAEIPIRGSATFTWRAGATAGSSVVTVVCTLGDQREAVEMTVVVK